LMKSDVFYLALPRKSDTKCESIYCKAVQGGISVL